MWLQTHHRDNSYQTNDGNQSQDVQGAAAEGLRVCDEVDNRCRQQLTGDEQGDCGGHVGDTGQGEAARPGVGGCGLRQTRYGHYQVSK